MVGVWLTQFDTSLEWDDGRGCSRNKSKPTRGSSPDQAQANCTKPKPGLTAFEAGARLLLELNAGDGDGDGVGSRSGEIIISHLSSYEKMGTARVACRGGCTPSSTPALTATPGRSRLGPTPSLPVALNQVLVRADRVGWPPRQEARAAAHLGLHFRNCYGTQTSMTA